MAETKNVALVFGASRISGWAVTKNLLSYPSETTFSRVIGLTHRPKTLTESGLPQDSRLELHSGIDLKEDLEGIRRVNEKMTFNAAHVADQLCSKFRFLVLQTGTSHYCVAVFRYMDKISWITPMRKDSPRAPSPHGNEIFYYRQVELIKEVAKGMSWGWCEVRPDQIVGRLCPQSHGNDFVEPLSLYLSLYRYVNGPGARVAFPGTKKNWEYTFTESSQDLISRAEIYLSVVKPHVANGEVFNIADNATPSSWSMKWPILTEYFGLKGTGPWEKGWEELGLDWIGFIQTVRGGHVLGGHLTSDLL